MVRGPSLPPTRIAAAATPTSRRRGSSRAMTRQVIEANIVLLDSRLMPGALGFAVLFRAACPTRQPIEHLYSDSPAASRAASGENGTSTVMSGTRPRRLQGLTSGPTRCGIATSAIFGRVPWMMPTSPRSPAMVLRPCSRITCIPFTGALTKYGSSSDDRILVSFGSLGAEKPHQKAKVRGSTKPKVTGSNPVGRASLPELLTTPHQGGEWPGGNESTKRENTG